MLIRILNRVIIIIRIKVSKDPLVAKTKGMYTHRSSSPQLISWGRAESSNQECLGKLWWADKELMSLMEDRQRAISTSPRWDRVRIRIRISMSVSKCHKVWVVRETPIRYNSTTRPNTQEPSIILPLVVKTSLQPSKTSTPTVLRGRSMSPPPTI